jgi:hypothetical protein
MFIGEHMFRGRRLILAGVTTLLIAGLGACGDDTWDDEPDTVFGLRDSIRHVPEETVKDTRPHMVKRCTSATRQVRHTERTGTGSRRSTRTWYTTERYQDCGKVRSGTETYRRVVRPEQWCVRLDDVDGDTAQDDVWYQVTRGTYFDALAMDQYALMEFTPTGTGC